jgi:arginine exporter protein ArgO
MRIRQVLYPNGQTQNAKVTAPLIQQFLRLIMKKFIVFILFSILLIISAYFLFNELYAQKRIAVLMLSLLGTIFCIYATHRFFKKYILQAKQPEPHS